MAERLAIAGIVLSGGWHPAAQAAWAGFDQPADHLCSFGSPLRQQYAAVVISGRFETGSGRAGPVYSLVFTADDGSAEITELDIIVDEREIGRFDIVSHVPSSSGASAVVTLDPDMIGTLFRATDNGKVLHIRVPPARLSYDFDLTGFATAADVFTDCMLRNTSRVSPASLPADPARRAGSAAIR
nr:hypothetical protein [uncultured Rhodopila sp.]